jgi:putative endonuclease
MTTAEHRRRDEAGRRAEAVSAWFLRLKGYRILARRFRTPVGEIDIVAQRGRVVAFVEVKARASPAVALESVSARQQRRIRRAAEAFLQRRPDIAGCDLRFDLVAVSPWQLPAHVIDAWRES